MTAHAPIPIPRRRDARRALLLGCALAGLCICADGRADAQAFQANPTTVFGSVTYDRATAGVETITIDTETAIINWMPGSGVTIFLPAGNTATFVNGPSVANYAVLNRILTMEPMRFDGTVLGRIGDLAAGTAVAGGTILFSSPGGIIIGAKAIFDVGNLVLTSLNVVDDGAGNFGGQTGNYQFTGGAGAPDAAIVTEAGAQINALSPGSYVAMVAPRIVHGGALRVDGSAAYVAGEEVQLNVNQGLFDIIVNVGSASATPIVHTGSTGGPASTDVNDIHRIYMVAVPKNQAITAILEGNVGFDPAVNAAVENGAIVLSAGFNVANGEVDRLGDFTPPPIKGLDASFHLRGGTVTSDLSGYAVTDMLASGQTTGNLNFLQDVSLFGGVRAHLFAGAGQNVSVAGNALVSAARTRSADPSIIDLVGGEALIFAGQGGTLTIAGNATVDASGQGTVNVVTSIAGSGTGGTAGVFADQGIVQINGNLSVLANGTGGALDLNPNQGGAGTGGDARLRALNGGSVMIGGRLAMDASGTASRAGGLVPITGAAGTGGDIEIDTIVGGSITIWGPATLTAEGRGGNVLAGAGNVGGAGQGGNILINVGGGIVSFAGTGTITMSTGGFGGLGPDGGAAQGGNIFLDARDGQIVLGGAVGMNASGIGGDAAFEPGGTGGAGTGGEVRIVARSGPTPSQIRGGVLAVSVQGTGGMGGTGLAPMPAGRGGDGTGGSVSLLAESGNGALQFGAVIAFADGTGGNGGAADVDGGGGRGGDGTGGDVQAGTVAGPALPTLNGSARFGSLDLRASGLGGPGGSGSGAGGNAAGGTLALLATGVLTSVQGPVTFAADATGGAGGDSVVAGGAPGALGEADGGQLIFAAAGGTLTAGNVTGSATANGDNGTANSPGEWHVRAAGGSVTFANLMLTALATGTPAVRPFSSLEPLGGVISVPGTAWLISLGEIRVTADGAGRVGGGTLSLFAGQDAVFTHTNRGPGAFTIDVTDLAVEAENFTASQGTATRASDETDILARGTATIAGSLTGRGIEVNANALDVTPTGAIGDAATELVRLQATGNASVAGQVLGRDILLASAILNVAGTGTIGAAAGDRTELRTTGDSTIAGRVLGADILVTAANVTLAPTGAVGDAASQQVEIRAVNNAGIAGTVLGGNILVASAGLNVMGTGTIGSAASNRTELRTTGDSTIAGRVLGRDILVGAANVALAPTGAVGDATSQQVEIRAVNNAGIAGTVLGGNILVASASLNVAGTGTIGSAASTRTELRTTGDSTIAGRVLGRDILVGAANVTLAPTGAVGDGTSQGVAIRAAANAAIAGTVLGRNITVEGAVINLAASGAIGGAGTDQASLNAAGNAAIAGRVLGRNIQIASADIDIGTTGAIGDAATELAAFVVNPNGQTALLGGAAQGPGYTLTAAEAGRIRAGILRLTAPALGANAALVVRDLTLAGGGAAAGIGTLEIVTPGIARVEGGLLMTNARAADGISINAGARLEVVTPGGGVRVRDGAGNPGGTLTLASNNVWIASQAILDRLRADPDYAGRDADLIDNGGIEAPRGYVEANGVTLATGGTLFVQNSGPPFSPAFAGVTVGPGGLVIRSTGPGPATVTAFGRGLNPDGSVVVGEPFFRAVTYQTAGGVPLPAGYTAGSTLNTCIIVTGQCGQGPVNPGPSGRDPTLGPTGGSPAIPLPPGADQDDLVDTSFSAEGLIEEPVTSGGESGLWACDDDDDDARDCDPGND